MQIFCNACLDMYVRQAIELRILLLLLFFFYFILLLLLIISKKQLYNMIQECDPVLTFNNTMTQESCM